MLLLLLQSHYSDGAQMIRSKKVFDKQIVDQQLIVVIA
jgi:hypothetical protein